MSVDAGHGRLAREAYERCEYQEYLRAVRDRTEQLVRDALHGPLTAQEASITARVKESSSFEVKAAKCIDGRRDPRYLRPLSSIHDQVALRVVVLHVGFLNHARDLIQAVPELVVEEYEDKSLAHSANGSFGYGGIHLLIRPVEVGVPRPDHDRCGTLDRTEIQVRTQAQHAWAEVEHRLRYKGDAVEDGTSRTLDRAAALLETADDMLYRLVAAAEAHETEPESDSHADPTTAAEETILTLPELLERRFPGARTPPPSTIRWIRNCARELGLGDVATLDRALADVPLDAIEDAFEAAGHSPRSQARQLDDALLWLGQERYIEAAENGVEGTSDRYARGRPGILRWRLERLREGGVVAPGTPQT